VADVQSNIQVNLDASQALAQLKSLQTQLAQFNNAIATSNKAAARAQANLTSNLINSVNATGKFAASITTIKSSTDSFTDSLERNKFSTREYFRYAGGATKSFGKLFKTEFDTIGKVAEERVKTMQTQYIKMGRDANGAIKAIAVRPLALDMNNLATKTALAAQKQQLLNQLLKQGSTNLLNFGKNTQWAGRQLMVGFTIPLSMLAVSSSKTFMALEKQAIRFKRVYGEMFTTSAETSKALKEVELLAKQFTKYGVAVEKTMQIAADAAATGKMGADLMAQVAEATRLAVLGGVEQEQALETTISLTNAFGIEADKLRGKIDFLNAVENQTVLNIEDLTIAIPKAAPVIRQLGGDVEDLAFFMTAMKEGGINASEGANALKSGLASLINPSKKASAFLADFGVNIKGIVESNKGDIKSTVIQFAQALDTLDPLNRARAIEQLFGKFQFSRLSTLFQNITKDGTQASRTLNLASNSIEELAILSERELAKVENATGTKFKKTMEDLKVTLAPIGEQFLKAVTPIVEFVGKILEKFNGLSDGVKSGIVKFIGVVGLIGPAVLMTFGLIANGAANIIKLFITLRKGFMNIGGQSKILGEQTQYMTSAQLEAVTVAASLDQAHSRLRQSFLLETQAANQLTAAYQRGVVAANNFARVNPGMMKPGFTPKKFNKGGLVPGSGNTDTVPAMLTPGEFVVNKQAAQENRGLLPALNRGGYALRGVGTKMVHGYDTSLPKFRVGSIEYAKAFVAKRKAQQSFLGMPAQNLKKAQERQTKQVELDKIATETYQSPRARNMLVTNPGERVSPSTGRSFPSSSVGGVYRKPNGDMVFVKPMPSEKAALAEMRATEIARDVHGLVAPQQKLTLIADPNDPTGHRRYFALESKVDPRIANVPQEFTKEQTIKQLVASTLRGDKDLAPGNIGGNVLADTGPAGVFSRASGPKTEYAAKMPSMEEQAMVNLLGVNGGARKFFAQSTSDIAKQMSPVEYDRLMRKEINEILPKLKTKIGGMNLTPEEIPVYEAMIARLEAGSKVDWSKFQPIHAAALNKGGFVERQFGTIPQNVINPFGLPNLGTTGMVAGHFTAQNKENVYAHPADIPLYHETGTRFENYRVSSGVTTFIPQGYNQFTESYPGIIVEPYPLTYDDAHSTNNKLLSYIDELNDEYAKATNQGQRTKIANRQLAARIALAELQADAQAILGKGNRSDPRKAYVEAQADRFALTTSMAEGETFEDRQNPNSIYAKKRTQFLNEHSKGNSTLGIARGLATQAKQEINRGYEVSKIEDEIAEAKKAKDTNRIKDLEKTKQSIISQGIVLQEKGMSAKSGKVTKKTKGRGTHKLRFAKGHNQLMQQERADRAKTRNVTSMRAIAGLMHRSGQYSAGKFVNSITAKWMAKNKLPVPVAKGGYVLRSKGTGGYGEPETVPALLTPGEFIADPALAQKIGPALQYINSGGKIEKRSKGTIVPGTGNKDTVPMMLNQGSFVVNKKSTEQNRGFLQRFNKGGIVVDPVTGAASYQLFPNDLDNIEQTPARRRASMERLRASRVGQFASKAKTPMPKMAKFAPGIGGLAMGASMGLGMSGNMQGSMIAMGLSMAAPLMKTPIGALATALVGVGATYYALKKKNEALAVKTMETTQAMGASSKSLNELAVFANKVTGTELMNRRRANSFSQFEIKPGKTTFGQAYVQSETGQQKIKDITSSMKATNKVDTQDGIASQLATSIASGTLTASQAQSIAAELGKQLNDYSFGINVNSKLISLMGPNGENALKDPIGIRVKLLDAAQTAIGGSSAKNLANKFNRLQNPFGKGSRNAKEVGTAVGLQSTAIEQSQELLNSFDAQTQKLIEQLEIKKKFVEADQLANKRAKERLVLVEKDKKINEQVVKFFNDVSASSSKAATSLLKTSETGAVAAYKGTAEQDIAGGAVEAIKDFKGISGDQQYAINLQLKGKNISPTEILNLSSLFKDDQKGTEALLKVLTLSPAQGSEASQVASMFVDKSGEPLKEVQKTLVLKMTEGSSDANQDNIEFFKTLGKTGTVVDLEIVANYLTKNSSVAENLKNIIAQIQKTKGKITMNVLSKIDGISIDETEALRTQLEYLDKLDPDQQKIFTITFLSNFGAIRQDIQALTSYLASVGLSQLAIEKKLSTAVGRTSAATGAAAANAKQVTAQQEAMATAKAKAAAEDEKEKGRNSLLDDMLKKLKLFNQATVKATGGFQELQRVMNSKIGEGQINFDGLISRLRKMGEGKLSEDYLDFVKNLTQEQLEDKTLMTKMGITTQKAKGGGLEVKDVNIKKALELDQGLARGEIAQNYDDTIKALAEMENRTNAINILRRQGFSEAEANNVVTTDGIALAITQGKIAKEDLKNIKEKQKELTKANFEYERFTKTAQMDAAESQSKQLQMQRLYLDLQEKIIENEYVKEKTVLNMQQNRNNYALDLIEREEEKINKSYDKQITALEEINRLRERENQLTSTRMSIADALAKGDISAASSAMQEYRNAKIQQVARTRMEALQKAKENAIKGVTSPDGKTRDQLEEDNKNIQNRVRDMENQILEKKNELDELQRSKGRMTRDQIDSAISTINLAIQALGPEAAKTYLKNIFTVLDGQAGAADATVKELTKDLDIFIKKMDDARIAATGQASLASRFLFNPEVPTIKPVGSTGGSTGGATITTPAPAAEQIIDSTGELLITPNKIVNGRIADSLPSVQSTVDTLKKFNEDIWADFAKAQGKTLPTKNPIPAINYGNYLNIPYRSKGGIIPKYMAMGGMVRMPYAEPAPAQKMNMGGMVRKYMASGGLARGTDTVPAMLTPGEYVINKDATQKFGPLLSAINSPTFRTPESMSSIKNPSGSQTEVNNSKTLYNYNLSVNVSNSNANPNDIARTVINQIKMIENQRIRGY